MIFKRPWLVLLLLILTLVFTVGAWARVWNGMQLVSFLSGLALSVSPWYLVISGAVWGIVGLLSAVMIWSGRPRTPMVVISSAVAYSLNFWIEQLFVMVSALRQVNWPFVIVLNFIVVLVVVLSFQHSRVRQFYGGRYG